MSALIRQFPMSRRLLTALFCALLSLTACLPEAEAQPAESAEDVETLIEKRYQRVYVPTEALPQLWSFQEGVLLGRDEFGQLLQRAERGQAEEQGRPAEFLLQDVQYTVERSGDVATIEASCRLTKHASGWAELRLPLAEVSLLEAKLDGKPAPLGLTGKEDSLVLLDRFTGTRELKLTLTTPIERSGTDELIRFAVFPPGAATLNMTVPAGRTIQINGVRLEADGPQPDARDIKLPIGGGGPVTVRLSDALSETLDESLVFASTDYTVAAERDSVRWEAVCQLRTFGKRFNKLEFAVPQRLEVTAVEALGLQSWEIQDDPEQGGNFRLQLSFRETLPDQIAVTLRGVQLLEEGQDRWRVAPLSVLGVTAHSGRLALTAPRDVRLKVTEMNGVRPAKTRWAIARSMAGQSEQYFDVWEEDFTLEAAVAELSGETFAAVSHVLDVNELDVLLSSVVTLQTQFTPVFELTAEIPAGWQPDGITEGNRQLSWQFESQEGDSRRVRIPLSPPLKPGEKRTLQFRLTLQREGGLFTTEAESFTLPTLELQNVRILEGTYAITAASALEVVPEEVTGMDPSLLGLPNERFGFRYQDSVIGGTVQVKRKTPHFNVSTQETIWLDEQLVHQQVLSTLDISGGGLRQVTVEVDPLPQVNVEMLALGNVRISEQRRTKTETGMRWTLTFDRYVTGTVQLMLPLLVERTENPWPVAIVRFPAAELQDQYLAFLAEDDQQLSLQVNGGDEQPLDPLDPADVPLTTPPGRRLVVAGYHLTQPGATASVGVETFEPTGVPTAVGRQLTLETLLLEQGTFQQQATLRFAAVGVQSLLVTLPEGSRLWSTMVDGQPLTARKTDGGFLVPLSGLTGGTVDHNLTVVYGLENEGPGLGTFGRSTLPAPGFSAVDGQGGRQPLPTLHSRWKLHHSADAHVRAVSPGVHQAEQAEEVSWRERFSERIGRLEFSNVAFSVAIGVGLCLFAGFIVYCFRRFSWRVIVPGLLGVVALGMLSLCLLPSVQRSREAPQYGRANDSDGVQSMETMAEPPMEGFGGEAGGMGGGGFADNEMMLGEVEDLRREQLGDFESKEKSELAESEMDSLQLTTPEENRRRLERYRKENQDGPTPPRGFARQSGDDPFDNEMAQTFNQPAPEAAPMQTGVAPGKPQSPGQPPAAPQAARPARSKLAVANQGLLSLPLTLQIPAQLETTVFETYHAADDGLAIRYLSQTAVQRLRWVCLAGTVLLFWLLRDMRPLRKASLSILLLGLGTAVTGVLPVSFLPLVEGVLAGCLVGLAIWLVLFLVRFVPRHLFDDLTTLTQTSGAAALLLMLGSGGAVLQAEEIKPAVPGGKSPIVFTYDLEQGPLAADQVFIPAGEYKRLSQQANPERSQPKAPAVYHIHEANYRAEFVPAEDEENGKPTISLRGRYVIEFYRSGEQKVTLPIGPSVVKSVQIDGETAGGLLGDNKRPAVLLTSPGVHVVDVEFELPAEVFGTAGQFDVQLLPVASGSLSFQLPDASLRVEVNDGKLAYRKVEREAATFVEIPITSGGARDVSWQPDVEASGSEFLSSESSREVLLGDQGAELRYAFQFRIAQGTFSEVEFQLPEGVQLKTLFGGDVAGWQRVDENRLRVLLKRAVDDHSEIGLSLFAPIEIGTEPQQWTMPDVQPLGVTREIGTWGLGWDSALEVRVEEASSVRQLPVNQFSRIGPHKLVEQFERVYRFTGRPHEISLTVYRRVSELIVSQYTVVDVQLHKTHVATHASVEVRGQPRLSLEFAMPADLQIIDLKTNDLEDWFVQSSGEGEERTSTLTVLFSRPQQGRIDVFARGHVQQEALDTARLDVQGLQLTGATRSTNYLAIGAAESLGLRLQNSVGWQTIDPQRMPSNVQQMASFAIRLGLSQSGTSPAPIQLSVLEGVPQLKANSVTLIAVTDLSLDYGLALEWQISNAAASKFSFIGPSWFVDRISFTSQQIRHISTTKLDDTQTLWTIETKRPLEKKFLVTAAISRPLPEDRLVTTPALNFVVAAKGRGADDLMLETQSHYAVLVNLGREPLEPVSSHQRQLIDPDELPVAIPEQMRRQAVEIVRITRSVVPSWELKELEQAELPPATIPLADLTMAIDGAGVWRMSAVYQVKNREQQFLPLVIPDGSQLLSVMVADRPARPVQRTIDGQQTQLIAMPTTGAADLAVKVHIILEGRLSDPLLGGWGRRRVSLPSPQILTKDQSSDYGIPVMHTVWTLSTPEEMHVRAVQGDGTNVTEATTNEVERITILNSLQSMVEMAKIAKSEKYSSRQRQRARQNLKTLSDDVQYFDSSGDYGESVELSISGALEDVKAVVVEQADVPEVSPVDQQSLGRNFVASCNSAILDDNQVVGLKSQTIYNNTAESVDGVVPGHIKADVTQRRDIKLPSALKGTGVAGKNQVPSEREQLLEENLRQNSVLNYEMLQKQQLQQSNQQAEQQLQYSGAAPNLDFNGDVAFQLFDDAVEESPSRRLSERDRLSRGEALGFEQKPQSGGLSLPIDVPQFGHSVSYSKVGGQPELQIEVYSRAWGQSLLGIVWAIGLLAVTLWMMWLLPRFDASRHLGPLLALGLLGSLLAFVILPTDPAALFLVVAIVAAMFLGGLAAGSRNREASKHPAEATAR